MSLAVTRTRVKEKCSITSTTYDTTIDNLISEQVPVISYAIRDEHIADTGNTGLQATLNLGALEVVCGENLDQIRRETGAMEHVRLGDFELWPALLKDSPGPFGLKESGWARLRPFLKTDQSGRAATVVSGGGKPSGGAAA